MYTAKEKCVCGKRDLCIRQKRNVYKAKETCDKAKETCCEKRTADAHGDSAQKTRRRRWDLGGRGDWGVGLCPRRDSAGIVGI